MEILSQFGQRKSRITLTTTGDDGLTGDKRRGIKTRGTGMIPNEFGISSYQRNADKNHVKQIKTMGENYKSEKDPFWIGYENFCYWWSNQFRLKLLNGRPSGKMGMPNVFQVDHIYTVWDGFINHISPFNISDMTNLQVLASQANAKKHDISHITIEELLNRCDFTLQQSNDEFDMIMEIITNMENIAPTSVRIFEEFKKKDTNARIYKKLEI